MQGRRRGVKAFLRSPIGQIVLLILAILALTGAFLVGGILLAILAALLFGLGLPIWVGAKRTRYLAIMGVAILAVSPAIITAVEVPLILTPPGAASSADGLMQNATVTPFSAPAGTNFTWSVTVVPSNLPYSTTRTLNVTLYVSTCPGATGNSSPYCSGGYPFYWSGNGSIRNLTKSSAPQTVIFHFTPPSPNIWSWQIAIYYANWTGNSSSGQWTNLTYELLAGDSSYNSIEGPVNTDWGGVYSLLVGSIYLSTLLYVGIVFFLALLIYLVFRLRRQRRLQEAERSRPPPGPPSEPGVGSAPLPSGATPSTSPSPPPPSGSARTTESRCPNCEALVYPNETFCWKCGASLTQKGSSARAPAPPKG